MVQVQGGIGFDLDDINAALFERQGGVGAPGVEYFNAAGFEHRPQGKRHGQIDILFPQAVPAGSGLAAAMAGVDYKFWHNQSHPRVDFIVVKLGFDFLALPQAV